MPNFSLIFPESNKKIVPVMAFKLRISSVMLIGMPRPSIMFGANWFIAMGVV